MTRLNFIFFCGLFFPGWYLIGYGDQCWSQTLLGSSSIPSPYAQPGYAYSFPFDHGTHDNYQIEWWYFTGHLFTETERRFGFELTFFRRKVDLPSVTENPSAWAPRQLYLAHLALTDIKPCQFHYDEKISRAGLGKAGASESRLEVWIDQWKVHTGDPNDPRVHLQASNDRFSLDLQLHPEKNPVIHGLQGVSRKGSLPTQASHYYSFTRLDTEGRLRLKEEELEVKGISWMDHEFGSGELGDDQVGWDWFSLQLDSGMEIMVYRLRRTDGGSDPASSGTVVFPDGQSRHLKLSDLELTVQDYWESPNSYARYPSRWTLNIPSLDMTFDLKPICSNQELVTNRSTHVTYWEGSIDVHGMIQDSPVKGLGYVELTGYAAPLKKEY